MDKRFLLNKSKTWVAVAGAILLTLIGFTGYCLLSPTEKVEWTGFRKSTETSKTIKTTVPGKEETTTTKEVSGKTLWDWMSVLGVPASLAILGFWLQRLQNDRANQQAEVEKAIAENNQREEALQDYFDRLSELLIDKNLLAIAKKKDRKPGETELVRAAEDVIQARTISILRRFEKDEERKSHVIQFLIDTEIITLSLDVNKLNFKSFNFNGVNLQKANLAGVDFVLADGINLEGTDSREANLEGAKLTKARLAEARLGGADLRGTNFRYAKLRKASFYNVRYCYDDEYGCEYYVNPTKLMKADFTGADLTEADLAGADFSGVDLSGVTLTGAVLVKIYKQIFDEDGNYYEDPRDDFYAVLKSAKLCNANLEDVVFENVNMSEADLRGANLKNADLRGANLENANFEGANLKGVKNLTEEQWETTLDYRSFQRSMDC